MRQAVESRLQLAAGGNEKKLEQMRATVDEKLQSTLEQRLGQSFQAGGRAARAGAQGLGRDAGLARDVGSLNAC
jgi:DNA recombination protein RmuC